MNKMKTNRFGSSHHASLHPGPFWTLRISLVTPNSLLLDNYLPYLTLNLRSVSRCLHLTVTLSDRISTACVGVLSLHKYPSPAFSTLPKSTFYNTRSKIILPIFYTLSQTNFDDTGSCCTSSCSSFLYHPLNAFFRFEQPSICGRRANQAANINLTSLCHHRSRFCTSLLIETSRNRLPSHL